MCLSFRVPQKFKDAAMWMMEQTALMHGMPSQPALHTDNSMEIIVHRTEQQSTVNVESFAMDMPNYCFSSRLANLTAESASDDALLILPTDTPKCSLEEFLGVEIAGRCSTCAYHLPSGIDNQCIGDGCVPQLLFI